MQNCAGTLYFCDLIAFNQYLSGDSFLIVPRNVPILQINGAAMVMMFVESGKKASYLFLISVR